MYGEEVRCIQVWIGKPERKKTLGRSTCRREDNIEMDHQ
jgi:hypothetical protein